MLHIYRPTANTSPLLYVNHFFIFVSPTDSIVGADIDAPVERVHLVSISGLCDPSCLRPSADSLCAIASYPQIRLLGFPLSLSYTGARGYHPLTNSFVFTFILGLKYSAFF